MRGILIVAGGWALLASGAALLVLPGPGIPLVLAGLTVLGRRYHWARNTIAWLRRQWQRVVPPRVRS